MKKAVYEGLARMRRAVLLLSVIWWAVACTGAAGEHFITDPDYRREVRRDFKDRRIVLEREERKQGNSGLFSIFDREDLSLREREALEFLYAYSPLSDLAVCSGDFWLENVRRTFRIQEEVPWGRQIPEDVFRHYVLPLRGNNEALDSARLVFGGELLPRLRALIRRREARKAVPEGAEAGKGSSAGTGNAALSLMEEAALEVNHWCHEKASYRPTDARTCSPQAIIARAYGRCGEESVFVLAALRSVGIPARQIYTPRWAHCDDNHAWIEVWTDGVWKYLGACEPEPALDMAWFTYPASRGLFMQAKVFGKYWGGEEVVRRDPLLTYVNVTDHYTDTRRPVIRVEDSGGRPVPGALVEYKIYNYAEYNTVAEAVAGSDGTASLSMGIGGWIVWASSGERYGFIACNPAQADTFRVVLNRGPESRYEEAYRIVPPAGKEFLPPADEPARRENDGRLAREDSLRAAYVRTFLSGREAQEAAFRMMDPGKDGPAGIRKESGVPDPETVLSLAGFIETSRGNAVQVRMYAERIRRERPDLLRTGIALLGTLTDKDLQDFRADVLYEHLICGTSAAAVSDSSAAIFRERNGGRFSVAAGLRESDSEQLFRIRYALSPRIGTEQLTGWRPQVREWLQRNGLAEAEPHPAAASSPETVRSRAEGILRAAGSLYITDSVGRGDVYMTPGGTAHAGAADPVSADLFFVAACRTAGIPARLDPADGRPQYRIPSLAGMFRDGEWITVSLEPERPVKKNGRLLLVPQGGSAEDPLYYIHFTISRLENGRARLIRLGGQAEGDMGAGMHCSAIFSRPAELEAGTYLLVAGARKSDGTAQTMIRAFSVEPGLLTRLPLAVPQIEEDFEVLGRIGLPLRYRTPEMRSGNVPLPAAGYTALAWIDPGSEPTSHLMRDMSALREEFEKREIVLTFLTDARNGRGEQEADPRPLPRNLHSGIDAGGALRREVVRSLSLGGKLPLLLILNGKGEVVFVSEGYRTGLGYQMLKYL